MARVLSFRCNIYFAYLHIYRRPRHILWGGRPLWYIRQWKWGRRYICTRCFYSSAAVGYKIASKCAQIVNKLVWRIIKRYSKLPKAFKINNYLYTPAPTTTLISGKLRIDESFSWKLYRSGVLGGSSNGPRYRNLLSQNKCNNYSIIKYDNSVY